MTTIQMPLPQWLVDAVLGLVTSAYEAGRSEAAAAPSTLREADSLTLAEAAESLRIGMTTMNRLVTSGELATYRVGKRRFVRATDLAEYRERAA